MENEKGTVVLSFCNGDVVIHLRVNKSVSVSKKGSIIIKDKKELVTKTKK